MDSLVINIDKSQMSENFGNQLDKGSFKFYYFVQNGYFHVGLIDSSQIQMMEGLLDFYFE